MRQDKLTGSLRRGGRCLKRQNTGGGVGTILSNVLKKRSCISRTAPRLLCTLEPGSVCVGQGRAKDLPGLCSAGPAGLGSGLKVAPLCSGCFPNALSQAYPGRGRGVGGGGEERGRLLPVTDTRFSRAGSRTEMKSP
ncbi:unnamed protein product, partial [Lepidochelys olivacea]